MLAWQNLTDILNNQWFRESALEELEKREGADTLLVHSTIARCSSNLLLARKTLFRKLINSSPNFLPCRFAVCMLSSCCQPVHSPSPADRWCSPLAWPFSSRSSLGDARRNGKLSNLNRHSNTSAVRWPTMPGSHQPSMIRCTGF